VAALLSPTPTLGFLTDSNSAKHRFQPNRFGEAQDGYDFHVLPGLGENCPLGWGGMITFKLVLASVGVAN